MVLRRTFGELDKSLIREAIGFYPKEIYRYNSSSHTMTFPMGDRPSIIDFGYLQNYEDTSQYQSAEYDIIRFDELTHFDPDAYQYMISRLRGANSFPKQVKSSTNPGRQGHKYVKGRFIDGHEPLVPFTDSYNRSYLFIPSLVYENTFLMAADPGYIPRLEQLPESEREALLSGRWDAYSGLAFPEFDFITHTCDPFEIPEHWHRWMGCDNGYADPFSWGWYTVSPDGIVYKYREFTREYDDPKLLYTEQAEQVVDLMTHSRVDSRGIPETWKEKIDYIVAGKDAWNHHHRDESGKDLIDMYAAGGLTGFIPANTDRKLRKSIIHEYLRPIGVDPFTHKPISRFQVFRTCRTLISNLPDLVEDPKNAETYADCKEDHTIDETGYALISHHMAASKDPLPEKTLIQKHKEGKMRKNRRRH